MTARWMAWRPRSVRTRLTLWHLAGLIVVLVLYASGVFLVVGNSLSVDLDRQLQEDFNRTEYAFGRNTDGTLSWLISDRDPDEHDPNAVHGPWVCVWAGDRRPLFRDPLAPAAIAVRPAAAHASETPVLESVHAADGRFIRQLTGLQDDIAGGTAIVRVARSEEPMRRELARLLLVFGMGLPIACLIAGAGAYAIARRALAPIDRMADKAQQITAASLSERLPVANPGDELGHLATVFNRTFSRLEASFEQLRRFTADASHEMRTPLTAIRAVGEVGLREARSPEGYREVIGSMLEEADRLNRLVDSLLMLARADGGHVRLAHEHVDLGELAREVVDHLAVLAEDKQQSIELVLTREASVTGDHQLLRQAVVNLLDNAIKYTPPRGQIEVTIVRSAGEATLAVSDSGPGIPPEHAAHVFDRFYRIDKSRSREIGGFGLGLSIARWVVEAHGGRIVLEPGSPVGSTFRILLPVAQQGGKP
jgi:heavy metal sensor kinase